MGQGAGAPRASLAASSGSQLLVEHGLEVETGRSHDWQQARAGEGSIQVITGVQQDIHLLPGTIVILAEFIPSWLLLLRDRCQTVPYLYVKDECSWFRQSLDLGPLSCHQGCLDSIDWVSRWQAAPGPCSVFIQGSVAFCRKMLTVQAVLQSDLVVAVFAGPVRRLHNPLLTHVKLRHCEVGGVTTGLSSIVASRSILDPKAPRPWLQTPMHRFLVDLLKVDVHGCPCSTPSQQPDPRSWVAPSQLLEYLPAPSVFSAHGWVQRRLSPAELGLALDLPLECLDRFGTALAMKPSLGSLIASVSPRSRGGSSLGSVQGCQER